MIARSIFNTRWGVTFGTRHSWRDLGLLPAAPPDFGAPAVKTNLVDIPGMDGSLDLTEALGRVSYGTRKASLAYVIPDRREAAVKARHARLMNLLHGREIDICPDEAPDAYYVGRVSVGPIVHALGSNTVTITAELEPFRYDRALTDYNWSWLWDTFCFETGVIREYEAIEIDGTTQVTLVSSPLGGVPTVTNNSSGVMTISTPGGTFGVAAGQTRTLTYAELPRGVEEVTWTVTGSGTLTVSYPTGGF